VCACYFNAALQNEQLLRTYCRIKQRLYNEAIKQNKKQMPIYIGKIYLTNVELSEEIAESLIVFKPSAIEIH